MKRSLYSLHVAVHVVDAIKEGALRVGNQTLLWMSVHLVNISSPPEFTHRGQLMIEGQLVTY